MDGFAVWDCDLHILYPPGQLAQVVNSGNSKGIKQVLKAQYADVAAYAVPDTGHAALAQLVVEGGGQKFAASGTNHSPQGYGHYLQVLRQMPADGDQSALNDWALRLLQAHSQFQWRSWRLAQAGPWGVEGMNQRIAQLLAKQGLIAHSSGWYAGRPVLVTRNPTTPETDERRPIGITVAMPLLFKDCWP
ncbi:hypothetical protein FQA39_LY19303 [Lamprigera yunnana]|nr:hypothetical protein FQA39_LY19303 [Lamprigera yunnana]